MQIYDEWCDVEGKQTIKIEFADSRYENNRWPPRLVSYPESTNSIFPGIKSAVTADDLDKI